MGRGESGVLSPGACAGQFASIHTAPASRLPASGSTGAYSTALAFLVHLYKPKKVVVVHVCGVAKR